MKKSLVIVESPAKARTINKYLGRDFSVIASVGHILDLPKSSLGVDIENDFSPFYETIRGKAKVVAELKKASKGVENIYLAPDPDREGEAIAWHIQEALTGNPNTKSEKASVKKTATKAKVYPYKFHRVLFNEITKSAIKEALANPTTLDTNKVQAQQARRILDRIVGYKVSPLLWDKVRRGLSAGRVQSVAVRIICDREAEVLAFKPKEYWSITAAFENFSAKLAKKDSKKIEIHNETEATNILKDIKGEVFSITSVKATERKRNPLPPFITSKLQQEASRKLSFSAKQTMMFAQQLYEGVEMGKEGPVGLITYMRTDSPRVSNEAITALRGYITETYGKDYLPTKPNFFKSKKRAQDAHEAIRPTSIINTPEVVKKFLSKEQYRLYHLIWNRFVASQMAPAILDQTRIAMEVKDYTFTAAGSVIKFPGFIAVYEEGKDEVVEKDAVLPPLKEGESHEAKEVTPTQHFTKPPPRFTEATLVKELEEKGIGRPSTYASIISTIIDREYVLKEDRRLRPTELGKLVTELLVKSFPKILNAEFTAHLEDELDQVEEGKLPWVGVMKDFYTPFKENLEKAKVEMKNVKAEAEKTDLKCEKCGSEMVIKWGRRGKFLACTGYPECKSTSDFSTTEDGTITRVERDPDADKTDEKCPKCSSAMTVKNGRFGRFLACTAYPDCKGTKSFSIGVKCPEAECDGMLVEKRSKRGRTFYGCSKYPTCKYATWEYPKKDAEEEEKK
ncbi:MAG: type I DNA topoisomerase [Deltaproteobacteria bacterium]|nr:type I DNA topoisomerase [Deltaproteobacteria bacterium]